MHCPTDRTAHTTALNGPVVDHWLEWKIAQTANASAMQDRSGDPNLHSWVLYHLSYVPLPTPLIDSLEEVKLCWSYQCPINGVSPTMILVNNNASCVGHVTVILMELPQS